MALPVCESQERKAVEFSRNNLPRVYLYGDQPVSDNGTLPIFDISGRKRLLEESHTFSDNFDFLANPAGVSALEGGKGVYSWQAPAFPFSRDRPVRQRVFRADGSRPRDGAGLGSPVLVDPGFLDWGGDPLSEVRNFISQAVSQSELNSLLERVWILTEWKVALEDDSPLDEVSVDISSVGLPLDSPFSAVKEALHTAQSAVQTATDLIVDENLAAWQRSLRAQGWAADFGISSSSLIRDSFQGKDVSPTQPFRLNLIWEMAERVSDPDAAFLAEVRRGLTLGASPLLTDCLHFPRKSDENEFCDFVAWSRNYRSAEELHEEVLACLAEDMSLGVVEGGYTWKDLCQRLRLPAGTPEPDRSVRSAQVIPGVAVSRLGCIDESSVGKDGSITESKFRLVFDGTVSGVNSNVSLPILAETPTFLDGESLFSVKHPEGLIGCKIDVKSAFKRILLSRDQYAQTLFPLNEKWFFSKSCPMGMKSSPYHWVRLNSIIHRLLKRLGQDIYHASLMYIDDSLYASLRSKALAHFSLNLIFLRMLGVPISWKKLEIGSHINWVGFRLNFETEKAYLSAARLEKIESQMRELSGSKRISISEFRQLTFRMVWVSQSFPLSKVFLHKFFKHLKSPALQSKGHIYGISHLQPVFDLWTTMIRAARSWSSAAIPRVLASPSLTRTDAAAESEGIFVGGWHSSSHDKFLQGDLEWFAFRVLKEFFPDAKEQNSLFISSAEALGVAISIALWGAEIVQSDSMVTVMSAKRLYSPSPNLAHSMECLVRAAFLRNLRPKIEWTSGESNKLADSLSRKTIDSEAARHLAWLPQERRASSQVLYELLPELSDFLLEI